MLSTILFIHTNYVHVRCTILWSPRCKDVASVQRRRLGTKTSPRCKDVTSVQRRHLGAKTSPRCKDVASVQRRRFGAETSPWCKDVASVQRHAHHGRGQVNWVKWYPLV